MINYKIKIKWIRNFLVFMLAGLFLSSCASVEKPAGEPPRLIVRGDDMGMNHTCNVAVKKSFEEGILTCASLMVPAPWFEEAARMCRENPEWCIGLHLTLNSEWKDYRWKPVLPITEVPSLVDEDGYFYPTTEAFLKASPDMLEVKKELRAQMELAKKRGVDIQYIDTHMWTARATPELFAIVQAISRDYDLPISQDSGEERLSIYEVPYQLKEETLAGILRNLQPGLWLLVVHPGLDTLEERALVDINPEGLPNVAFNRAAVTRALTSERIKNIVKNRGIQLIDYRDIPRINTNK